MSSIRSVLIFCALLFLVLTPAFSQQDRALAEEYLTQAQLMLEATKAYDEARDLYVMAADADTTFAKANFEAGHLYLITYNRHRAVKYLQRVYREDPSYRFDIEYMVGRSFQYAMEWDKALEFYDKYKNKLASKPNYVGKDKIPLDVVARNVYECENGKRFVANPQNYSIVNIGREINSDYDDYSPVLNEDGDEIVFTTRRKDGNLNEDVYEDNKPWEDVFWAKKENGKWNFAKNIGPPVNTLYHNSNTPLSADGTINFLYTDDGAGDILQSNLQSDGSWSEPEPLPGIINSSYSEKSVSISKDEQTLYFTSNRPGGFGGLDLYKATKNKKNEWTYVKNLGPTINTEFDEEGPFIDYDGVTLYFSSRGHEGMGGHDIFKSTFNAETNRWSTPANLGYPINTPDEDVFFISSPDGKTAYYSSLKEEGMGYQDIYVITIPEGLKNIPQAGDQKPIVAKVDSVKKEPVAVIEPKKDPEPVIVQPKEDPKPEPKKTIPLKYLVTVTGEDNNPVNAKVKLVGAKDNVIVKSTKKADGVTEFTITSTNPKDYRLSVESDGYVFVNEVVNIKGATTEEQNVTRTVTMRKIAVGVTKVLRNLYFDFDKATFKTESYTELNKLEAMLRENSRVVVEIGGHTDGVGSVAYNLFLSRKRAEAVKDYLVHKGIDARRVKAKGYGKTRPLASNDDEDDGRELNRRVEFKVLAN